MSTCRLFKQKNSGYLEVKDHPTGLWEPPGLFSTECKATKLASLSLRNKQTQQLELLVVTPSLKTEQLSGTAWPRSTAWTATQSLRPRPTSTATPTWLSTSRTRTRSTRSSVRPTTRLSASTRPAPSTSGCVPQTASAFAASTHATLQAEATSSTWTVTARRRSRVWASLRRQIGLTKTRVPSK